MALISSDLSTCAISLSPLVSIERFRLTSLDQAGDQITTASTVDHQRVWQAITSTTNDLSKPGKSAPPFRIEPL